MIDHSDLFLPDTSSTLWYACSECDSTHWRWIEVPLPYISGTCSQGTISTWRTYLGLALLCTEISFSGLKMFFFCVFLEQYFPESGGTCSCSLQMQPVVFMWMWVAVSAAMRLIVASPKSHCQLVSWHKNYSVTFCALTFKWHSFSAMIIYLCMCVSVCDQSILTSSKTLVRWSYWVPHHVPGVFSHDCLWIVSQIVLKIENLSRIALTVLQNVKSLCPLF